MRIPNYHRPINLSSDLSDISKNSENLENLENCELVRKLAKDTIIPDQPILLLGESEKKHLYFQNSLEFFEDLYFYSPIPYFVLDRFGVIRKVNESGANFLGLQIEHLIQKPFLHLTERKNFKNFLNHMWRCRKIEGKVVSEIELITQQNKSILVQLISCLYREPVTDEIYYLTVIFDLTGIKVAEEKRINYLREQRIREESEQREKRYFLLSEISKILISGNLNDYQVQIEKLLHLIVPSFADWCMIDFYTKESNRPQVHLSQISAELYANFQDYPLISLCTQKNLQIWQGSFGREEIIHSGRVKFIPQVTTVMLGNLVKSEQQIKLLKDMNIQSCMSFPLIVASSRKILGAITFLSFTRGYILSDFNLAEEIGQRISFMLENSLLYKEAQEAVALRDEFISIASHELKTPLTPLKLWGQILERQIGLHQCADNISVAPLQTIISSMNMQIRKITFLIDELLDVSRIQAGKLKIELTRTDLTALLKRTIQLFTEHIQISGTRILVNAPDEVWGEWDPFRIEQVLVNLISNAIKYGDQGLITVTIKVCKHQVKMCVSDQGKGIPKIDQLKIFDRFERMAIHSKIPGLGLGLFITKKIVEAHHGSLWVESDIGKGSKFYASLPYIKLGS